mmetsp:Transcript_34836/g.69464  ORF Transcript_34836/g.69464 Transcript_34836/m.69464 type:complete len:151 (-) Transcript_34836:265-717(-)
MHSAPDSPPAGDSSRPMAQRSPIDDLESLLEKYSPSDSVRMQQAESLRLTNPVGLLPNTMQSLSSLPDGVSTASSLYDVIEIAKWIAFYGGKTANDLVELTHPNDPRRTHALEFYEAWTRLTVGLDIRLASAVEEQQNSLAHDLHRYFAD